MYSLAQAYELIAKHNMFDTSQQSKLADSVALVLEMLPSPVVQSPSFCIALRGQEKYLSVNIMNYLLFRTPAYTDAGGPPHYDCHIIFERSFAASSASLNHPDRITFQFQDFPCVNTGLWYDEVLAFPTSYWQAFQDACLIALTAKRTRSWESNISWKLNTMHT